MQIKRQLKSTVKVNKRGANSVAATPSAPEAPPSTLRRSSRKRVPAKSVNDLQTPLATGRRGQPTAFSTPAITPKFDPSAPIHRTAMRLAKPNETLMSLSGSPVYSVTTTAKKRGKAAAAAAAAAAQISLGHGRTLVLPEVRPGEPAQAPELDDEAREKLESISSQINSMLQMSKMA